MNDDLLTEASSHTVEIVAFVKSQTSTPLVGMVACLIAAAFIYSNQEEFGGVPAEHFADLFKFLAGVKVKK